MRAPIKRAGGSTRRDGRLCPTTPGLGLVGTASRVPGLLLLAVEAAARVPAREPRDCLVEREVRLERRGGRASPASGAASTSTCGGAAATAVSMSTGLTGITMSTPALPDCYG